eukprot:NODE_37_length_35953_cov_1.028037.p13 type:complete len:127 gc:universal NODE_37_length_35953_cov_1.028037:27633-28013(+)
MKPKPSKNVVDFGLATALSGKMTFDSDESTKSDLKEHLNLRSQPDLFDQSNLANQDIRDDSESSSSDEYSDIEMDQLVESNQNLDQSQIWISHKLKHPQKPMILPMLNPRSRKLSSSIKIPYFSTH